MPLAKQQQEHIHTANQFTLPIPSQQSCANKQTLQISSRVPAMSRGILPPTHSGKLRLTEQQVSNACTAEGVQRTVDTLPLVLNTSVKWLLQNLSTTSETRDNTIASSRHHPPHPKERRLPVTRPVRLTVSRSATTSLVDPRAQIGVLQSTSSEPN